MGGCCGRGRPPDTRPCLQQFSIIRSIGRGAFGKVCIVQERSSKKFFAMKYMSKRRCIDKGVAGNIIRELSILSKISHPFIVNLWYAFQDREYMYMISDLLLGGDLRYHLNQQGKFAEDRKKFRAKLYLCEIALAVQYLHDKSIIHRDIKPENILLDEQGHAHLTDLNLATQLESDTLATSFTGTRPYMAPEMYGCALGVVAGYDYRVDWWAMGVTFYEMLRGRIPYEFSTHCNNHQALLIVQETVVTYPSDWPSDLVSFLKALLCASKDRLASLTDIKKHAYTARIEFSSILARRAAPVFVPCKEGLNCDPMYEIEERIVVSTPIHRRRHQTSCSRGSAETECAALREFTQGFTEYSRHDALNGMYTNTR